MCVYACKLVVSGTDLTVAFRGFRANKTLVRQNVVLDLSKVYVSGRERFRLIKDGYLPQERGEET